MDEKSVIEQTRRWIADMVVALNLCPFARRVFEAETIRYVVTPAADERALVQALIDEALLLASTPISEIETTLLIHPCAFTAFLEYNDFLDPAEEAIADLGLSGVLQIASFHPDYQFADSDPDDPANYTNRSPYPMLHLLREDSVSAAAGGADELLEIPRRNIELLRSMGMDAIEKLRAGGPGA